MPPRKKRRELQGVVAVVAALAGFVGGLCRLGITLTLSFGIWIPRTVPVNAFTDPPGSRARRRLPGNLPIVIAA